MLALLCACKMPSSECVVNYAASDGGSIKGESTQTILYGENATKVTAVADTGYIFVKWSDGVVDAARTDTNVQQDISVTAEFVLREYTVSYIAGENGHIEGATTQTVQYGKKAATVTAVADENYKFLRWSDGATTAERSDTYVTGEISVTATFEELIKSFTFVYNNQTDFYAEQNNTEKDITLRGETFDQAKLIVPIREHFTFDGWYLDEQFTTRVTNEYGEVVMDASLFDTESTNLYAKWNNITEPPVYRILMVFVTKVHATLMSNKNPERIDIPIQVDYVMTDIERKICEKIPGKFQDWLNETFNGLVIFEVDTYFTTQPLGRESINRGGDDNSYNNYGTQAYRIPEVRHLLPNYRSVMTTFGMNDYDGLLIDMGGSASAKYGMVNAESLFANAFLNDIPLESIYETDKIWERDYWSGTVLPLYVHEFIHTVECRLKPEKLGEELHEAASYYSINIIEEPNHVIRAEKANILYLLGNMMIDGKRAGIPQDLWANEEYYDYIYDLFG
jgi:uncharacterized repeat protein (TIGR02543 family)